MNSEQNDDTTRSRCHVRLHRWIAMFRLHRKVFLSGILLTALSVAAAMPHQAFADDTLSQLANIANQAIQSGDYDAAIEKIDEAILLGDPNQPDPRLNFNKSIALYRAGDVDSARDLFSKVAGSAGPELAAKARFNLGNVDYAQAIKIAEQDKQGAISQLKSAITHYRASLRTDANDVDARANVELADRLIKQLQREEEQQKQDEQKENQEKQNDEKQNDEKQKEENEKKQGENKNDGEGTEQERSESENESDKKQSDQNKQNSEDQSESEKPESEKSESKPEQKSEQDQKDDPGDPDKDGQQKDQDDQSRDNPQNDKKGEDGEGEQASPPDDRNQPSKNGEKPPEGELKALNEQAEKKGSGKSESGRQKGTNEGLKEGQTMTMQEARKMLQAVRDRELRRRIQQLQQMRVRRVPVEKDW